MKKLYFAYDANDHHIFTIRCDKLDNLTLQMFSDSLRDAVKIICASDFAKLPFSEQIKMIRANL